MSKLISAMGDEKFAYADFIPYIPRVRARANLAGQSIATITQTAIAFTTEDYDTDTMHDLVTNNDRITIKTSGFYRITGWLSWAQSAVDSTVMATIRKNGAAVIRDERRNPTVTGENPTNFATWPEECVAGDYFQLYAWQDTGGARNVSDGYFTAELIGSGFQAVRSKPVIYYVTPVQFGSIVPIDGDEAYITVDATNGVVWHMRYNANSASAYKWEYLGGPPLFAEITNADTTASTTYVALSTPGPAIALPRAGDYDVETGFRATTINSVGAMSYDIGGTGAVDADMVATGMWAASGTYGQNASRKRRKVGLTAVTLTAKYKDDGASTGTYADRFMSVKPVRIS